MTIVKRITSTNRRNRNELLDSSLCIQWWPRNTRSQPDDVKRKNDMRTIKCKYCGKSYASPSEMRKRKCHSHPKGAWGGYCTAGYVEESLWGLEKHWETEAEIRKEREMRESEFKREYKMHTPLLDCVLSGDVGDDEPSEYYLQIRNSDLHQLAVDLANGINNETRDAINTIYALRAGCDYVLNNVEAQKEGSLNTWLDRIKQLKEEVVSWDFWAALYFLTKPIKDQSDAADNDFESNRENWKYWRLNSIAKLFHTRHVIPMLHAVNKKGNKEEKAVMNAVKSYIRKLKSESKGKGFDSGKRRCIETLSRRVNEYSFWGVLYCLYWITLRPTPWDDQKVWPIQAAQKDEKEQEAPDKQQATVEDNETNYLKIFREQTLGMSRVKDAWMGDPWVINLHKYFKNVAEPFCLISNEDDFDETLRTRLWSGECVEDAEAGYCKHLGEFLTELKWKILRQDSRPFLLMSGEFRGEYSGIDFSSNDLQPMLEEFSTWFQDDFLIGDKEFGKEFSHDSSHMWWSVKEPLDEYEFVASFPDILKHKRWCQDIRSEIISLGRKLVQFLPCRIDKETGKTVREKEKEGEKSLPNNSLTQKDDSGPLKELEGLIGLGHVKDEIRKLVELVKFNAARKANGLSAGGMTSHFVFTGNPGTGKTTVARIVADIYRQLGILKKGHLVEVDRSKLVAGYVGHTAIQTNAVVDSAMDGVLFIDEAYSLVAGGTSDFGSEAIATLLKRMEDARERIIVIVAGYSDEMSRFVKSNPGLESRFTKFIEFPDYSIDELVSIFDSIAKKNQFTCSSRAHELLRKTIEAAATDGHVSGNARYVRNLFNAVRERMARRVMKIENASMIQLQTIEAEDFGEIVGDTSQQLMKPSAVASVKNDTAQTASTVNFSKSQYLKDLRGNTLGMCWTTVRAGFAANISDKFGIHSDQARVRSNLSCHLWNSPVEGLSDGQNLLSWFTFHIFHDGKSFQLKVWGEFWGRAAGDTPESFHAIDFNSDEVKPCVDNVIGSVRDAWACFGVKGNSGCNPGDHIGGGDIWWNVIVPFKDHDELVSDEFSQKLRGSLANVAAAFATLLPYRISINTKK